MGALNALRARQYELDAIVTGAFSRFWTDDRGATDIEYGLIAGLIGVVIISAVGAVGGKMSGQFSTIASTLS